MQDAWNTLELIDMKGKSVQFQLPATAYNKAKVYEISAQGLKTLKQSCWLNDEVKFEKKKQPTWRAEANQAYHSFVHAGYKRLCGIIGC